MIRLTTFFTFLLFSLHSLANKEVALPQERIGDRVVQLQKQYDNLQKYIFNLQYTKDKTQDGTNFNTSQFIEQIRLLRKEVETLKKEMDLLRTEISNHNDSLDKKVIELQDEVSEREYYSKFLNMIDTELDAYSDLKNSNLDQRKEFVDTEKLKDEEKKYDTIMDMINHKNYAQATRELKKFIIDHPNSILTPNTFFCLGEIAFKQKNYTLAAINYFKGYQVDKNGEKSLSNLMMLSKSMVKIGKYATACKVVQHVEYNFPDAPYFNKEGC